MTETNYRTFVVTIGNSRVLMMAPDHPNVKRDTHDKAVETYRKHHNLATNVHVRGTIHEIGKDKVEDVQRTLRGPAMPVTTIPGKVNA